MPRKKAAEKKHWSYNAGERGRNWVRVYRQARDGKFFIEWIDGRKRARLLRGVTTRRQAKAKADELAAGFATVEAQLASITLEVLFERYQKEVTPTKGYSKQEHDHRAIRVWSAFFDWQREAVRRMTRYPDSLDRIDWERFVAARRGGQIPDWPNSVKNRQVQYDIQFLVAVLNWAVGAKLIVSNPWGTEIRRNQRWGMPKELNPHRPSMPNEIRAGLITHAPGWQFRAMLVIQRETRRRNNAVRQLLWSDIDWPERTIQWRGETDKMGKQNRTPMSDQVADVLRDFPSRAIGDVPVFPGKKGCTTRHTCQTWLRRAKARWLAATPEDQREGLRARLRGVGFHSEKRSGVRDPNFRALPPAIQEELAGTSWKTLRRTYDEITVEDMRVALEQAAERTRNRSETASC